MMPHAQARPALASKVRFQTDRITGKPILLFPEGALVLNPTGEAIVKLCDGKRTVNDIVNELCAQYAASPDKLFDEVTRYLSRLSERNLMRWDPANPEQEGRVHDQPA